MARLQSGVALIMVGMVHVSDFTKQNLIIKTNLNRNVYLSDDCHVGAPCDAKGRPKYIRVCQFVTELIILLKNLCTIILYKSSCNLVSPYNFRLRNFQFCRVL